MRERETEVTRTIRLIRCYHGLGAHGLLTTAVGHGITKQAQPLLQGARVATVVVVVVVITRGDANDALRVICGDIDERTILTIGTRVGIQA